jgi:hypothetical protein
METKNFLIQLVGITGLAIAFAFGLHQVPSLADGEVLSMIAIVLFTLLTLLVFWRAKVAAASANRHSFTNVVMGITMLKMFFSIVIIYAYLVLAEPTNKLFVLPFFGIYIIYTAYEVYAMMQLSRTKPKGDSISK